MTRRLQLESLATAHCNPGFQRQVRHDKQASYGFYVILKGSVRPHDPNSRGPTKDPKGPFEMRARCGEKFRAPAPLGQDVPQDSPAVSSCGAKSFTPEGAAHLQLSLLPAVASSLSLHALAHLLTVPPRSPPRGLRHSGVPVCRTSLVLRKRAAVPRDGGVLVKEVNEVAPFAGFIAEGESDVRRSTHALIQNTIPADRQGQTGSTCKPIGSETLKQPFDPIGRLVSAERESQTVRLFLFLSPRMELRPDVLSHFPEDQHGAFLVEFSLKMAVCHSLTPSTSTTTTTTTSPPFECRLCLPFLVD
ncbi:unnamed protein product [Gadus morhua 'NCC']